jgi:hypothetical protein
MVRDVTAAGNLRRGAIFALTIASAVPCRAQQLARSARTTVENDAFNFWLPPDKRPDDNYTHGARLGRDQVGVPGALRRMICPASVLCGSAVEIGQEIYTPTRDSDLPLRGERSYAGWLYVRGDVVAATPRTRRDATLIIGVTGPASLAERAQDWFHSTSSRFRTPLGWKYQLPTEPDGAVQLTESWHLAPPGDGARWADVVPAAHVTLGTLRSAFGAGGVVRLGDLDHPWLVDATPRKIAAFLFACVNGEAVARNLFIDGDTFRPSLRRDHKPFVGSWERGMGVRLMRASAEYRVVTLSKEYAASPIHTYGGITLSWLLAR